MKLRQYFRRRDVIVSAMVGGLGNQMFQYAAGRAIANLYGTRLVLDTTPLEDKGLHVARAFELQAYRIRAEADTLSPGQLRRLLEYKESGTTDQWPPDILRGTRIEGYWQNPAYFAHIRQELLNDFSLGQPPSDHGAAWAQRIQSAAHPVAMHFRRGDYVSNPAAAAYHGTCGQDYYDQAVSLVLAAIPQPKFFVFSDDPDWVRQSCALPPNSELIDARLSSSFEDIWLMSLCTHHVLANSSFSWWGAWLGSEDGMKIAPKRWYLNPEAAAAEKIIPPHWTRL